MTLQNYIGTKSFYKKAFGLMIPILIQNGITNFVNMLDNIMVGAIGQVEMTGVSVTNQLIFVFNLVVFGSMAGAGIFGAQYVGKDDMEGVRYTIRVKLLFSVIISVLGVLVFSFAGETLISRFLLGEGDVEDLAASLQFGKEYLFIIMISFLPYALIECFSSTLRENGKTMLPMISGLIAVSVNLILNYLLIFGHFGCPQLGVRGAAIATITSRFVEFFVILIVSYRNRKENPYLIGLFHSFHIPFALAKKIVLKAIPLMINEGMWASGMTFLSQCYSLCGYDVVSAYTIHTTFMNLFNVSFIAVGTAIAIMVGNELGAGKNEEAYDTARKLIVFNVLIGFICSALFACVAFFAPKLYNVGPDVQELAKRLMLISCIILPLDAFANGTYFTLRSGGQAFLTAIFDSGFVWAAFVPVAFVLSRYSNMSVLPMYFFVNMMYLFKDILGFVFVKRKKWIRNIVSDAE